MFKRNVALAFGMLMLVYSISCKKTADEPDEYLTTDTTGAIKDLASFPIGVGVRLDAYQNDPAYRSLVQTHFSAVTPENEFKHVSMVSNEGAISFAKTDEWLNQVQGSSLQIFGHTLVDWQSTNTTYLRSLKSSGAEVNVVPNAGFEGGSGNTFTDWTTQVAPDASGSFQQETTAPQEGGRAMKVNVTTPGQYQYSIQSYSTLFNLTPGQSYTLTFYAKSDVNGSRLKAVVQNANYQEKTFYLTPDWQQYAWTFTTNESAVSLKFHFPAAGVFYIDNINIPRSADGSMVIDPVKVDNAMKDFITQTVTRYRNQINAWDVINEPLDDGTGKIRTNPQPGTASGDKFYFAEFLGKDYIAKALQYAAQANPNAELYINEAKLESDGVKLDSMIQLISSLKAAGVPLHGIGLQMHLTIKNDRQAIENALQKLAATGLQIRISEMDVRVNPWNIFGYKASESDLIAQRDLVRFAIGAYFRYVPAAQRAGITFWDPTDKYSWIIINQNKEDAPTLFDVEMKKKPAYYGAVVGLRKKG